MGGPNPPKFGPVFSFFLGQPIHPQCFEVFCKVFLRPPPCTPVPPHYHLFIISPHRRSVMFTEAAVPPPTTSFPSPSPPPGSNSSRRYNQPLAVSSSLLAHLFPFGFCLFARPNRFLALPLLQATDSPHHFVSHPPRDFLSFWKE